MNNFGKTIRALREERRMPLRIVADALRIDVAILSKIERGQRKASRETVLNLAAYFGEKEENLLVQWLSDKLLRELKDEETAFKALKVAEEMVAYQPLKKTDRNLIIQILQETLQKDGRVAKAWIFGSVARGEDVPGSDLDLMVRFKDPDEISLLDHADIAWLLEREAGMRIDLVEEGYIKPFAWENVKKDLKLIYDHADDKG